jgi:hypothetical protein
MVLCPGGFSVARVFRSGGPHDLRVYVHLDGAPPPA